MQVDKKGAPVCPLCGKRIYRNEKGYMNAVLVNGTLTHKKCPDQRTKQERHEHQLLLDRVGYHLLNNGAGVITESGMNWKNVYRIIDELYSDGYSYSEQEYALDRVVSAQKGFYGYGTVANNIYKIISEKRRMDELYEQYGDNKEDELPTHTPMHYKKGKDRYEW